MKAVLVICLLSSVSLFCSKVAAQNVEEATNIFLQQVEQNFRADSNAYFFHRPLIIEKDCLASLTWLAPDLTEAEKDSLCRGAVDTSGVRLRKMLPVNSQVIDEAFQTVVRFHNQMIGLGKVYAPLYYPRYIYIRPPIFLRNNTLCLYARDVVRGGKCCGGSLNLYRLVDDKWLLLKTICEWYS
jgi:hypothetical protein